jgi:hypothetical protein
VIIDQTFPAIASFDLPMKKTRRIETAGWNAKTRATD